MRGRLWLVSISILVVTGTACASSSGGSALPTVSPPSAATTSPVSSPPSAAMCAARARLLNVLQAVDARTIRSKHVLLARLEAVRTRVDREAKRLLREGDEGGARPLKALARGVASLQDALRRGDTSGILAAAASIVAAARQFSGCR